MKCIICGQERSGSTHELNISGDEYTFFICDQCETEKGDAYNSFFDDVRGHIKQQSAL